MKRIKSGEITFCLFLIGLGAFAYIYINTFRQASASNNETFNFAAIPSIWSLVLIALVLAHMATLFLGRGRESDPCQLSKQELEEQKKNNIKIGLRTLFAFVALFLFVVLLNKINFFLLIALFLLSMFYILGQKSIIRNLSVSLVGSCFIYLVFVVLLQLPL